MCTLPSCAITTLVKYKYNYATSRLKILCFKFFSIFNCFQINLKTSTKTHKVSDISCLFSFILNQYLPSSVLSKPIDLSVPPVRYGLFCLRVFLHLVSYNIVLSTYPYPFHLLGSYVFLRPKLKYYFS